MRGSFDLSLSNCQLSFDAGGGKSLIYQLPALLARGTTLVVTPLISLMQDQCYNLRLRGIRAEMLNAATSQADSKAIIQRIISGGGSQSTKKGKGKAARGTNTNGEDDEREIKLIYVRSLPSFAPRRLAHFADRRSRRSGSKRARL